MALIMPVPDRLIKLTLSAGLSNFIRPDDPLIPALANAPAHRIFILTLPDVAEGGRGLDAATPAGWQFLAAVAGQTAAAEVSESLPGKPSKVRSVSRGAQFDQALQASRQAEELEQIKANDYELRVLRVPGLLIEALWLKGQAGAEDLLIPYLIPVRRPDYERALTKSTFLDILRNSPAARKDADDRPRSRPARI